MGQSSRFTMLLTFILAVLTRIAQCSSSKTELWITYDDPNGETLYLKDNRRPSSYTQNYGDCLGNSQVNVTRFDAAYYKDNMTVLFHLAGNTAIQNESLVLYIGVFAYGESRFDLTFNPCKANIASLCPLNASVPVSANGVIPVSQSDVSSIPPLALSIPDFEGRAILRIFANSTQSEIGCYSAVITNGHSFAHPKLVGSALRIFTLIAMIASFAPAIYGEAVPTMRLHYAHSLSVGVVFAVFQHIFFTGALSVNWPAVLVAWFHNFAWSGGMVYSASMQRSIDRLIDNVIGNTSEVGAAPSNSSNNNIGGGYDITQIYSRDFLPASQSFARDLANEIYEYGQTSTLPRREALIRDRFQRRAERALISRDYIANRTEGYQWYGHPIGAGMPLPGNYSGFAGTLAEENIRISNAFMTGFLWFLILLGLLVGFVAALKWCLEFLSLCRLIKRDRLEFFRNHWIGYSTIVALRTCFLSFFLIMFLTIFEFSFRSSAYVKLVAAVAFLIFAASMSGAAAYACYYKRVLITDNQPSKVTELKDLLQDDSSWFAPSTPFTPKDAHRVAGETTDKPAATRNVLRNRLITNGSARKRKDISDNIHDNDDFTVNFGWLASRYRRTRWWFFSSYLAYEFLRAVFLAGASGYPLVQVFGLIILESIAFAYILWARPFEGRRLNILLSCLGFSKVASVALSACFDVRFNLTRITTTVIGIVIIAIQGVLTIITLIAIIVGAFSSYMSVSRNREEFRPKKFRGIREKYFDHLDEVVDDRSQGWRSKKKLQNEVAGPKEQINEFEVRSIRRVAKIEDEDEEFASEMRTQTLPGSRFSISDRPDTPTCTSDSIFGPQRSATATPTCRSRAGSVRSLSRTQLPSRARPYKPSWNAEDFNEAGTPATTSARRQSRSLERVAFNEGPAKWLAATNANTTTSF